MVDTTHGDAIYRASLAITDVLKGLEAELGREVTEIEIRRNDVTAFSDEKRRVMKHVSIQVAPDEISFWG